MISVDRVDTAVSPCPWVRLYKTQRDPPLPANLRVKDFQDHNLDRRSTRLCLDCRVLLRELPYRLPQSGQAGAY
jgi:hypothetical protein